MNSKNNKKTTLLNSLEELAKYKDSLVQEIEPLINTETINCYNDNLNDIVYTVKIPESNIKSFNCKKRKFTNWLKDDYRNSDVNSELIEILKLNNQSINEKDMPMKFNGTLDINKRILDIFSCIPFKSNQVIFKWYYTGKNMNVINYKMNKQILRIYLIVDSDSKEMVIILLDPHHLLATSDFEKYKKINKYGTCISRLLKHLEKIPG